jgi:hypothetical protein
MIIINSVLEVTLNDLIFLKQSQISIAAISDKNTKQDHWGFIRWKNNKLTNKGIEIILPLFTRHFIPLCWRNAGPIPHVILRREDALFFNFSLLLSKGCEMFSPIRHVKTISSNHKHVNLFLFRFHFLLKGS